MLARLHLITDTHLQARFSHLALVEHAVQAGAPAVQVREKHWDSQRHASELAAIVRVTRGTATCIVVNDHLDAALAAGADGVHLGQGDASPSEALQRMPPGTWVGATVHNRAELEALAGLPVHYVGVGPVFGTRSKRTDLPPLGLAGLRELCNLSPYPVIAIGALDARNLRTVLDAGAYGVAVLSAFTCADHPQAAAAALLHELHLWGA